MLYTSRNKGLAGPLHAMSHEVPVLESTKSLEFLARWSGKDDLEALPQPQASEIAFECQGLPLGLTMIGATLYEAPNEKWGRILKYLREKRLDKIGKPLADYEYSTLDTAIEISVQDLDDRLRAQYLALAVLPSDFRMPVFILKTLWNSNEDDANDSVDELVDRSLAIREETGIRLHNLLSAYLHSQYPDREALSLIQGAIRLSSHVLEKDPKQFASQLIGRLLGFRQADAIASLLNLLANSTEPPSLLPLTPTLIPPAGALLRRIPIPGNWDSNDRFRMFLSKDGHSLELFTGKGAITFSLDGRDRPAILQMNKETGDGHKETLTFLSGKWSLWIRSGGKQVREDISNTEIVVRDIRTAQVLCAVQHPRASHAILFLDATVMVSIAYWEGTIMVWNVPSALLLHKFQHHCVDSCCLSANARILLTQSRETHSVEVWDLSQGRHVRSLEHWKVDWADVSSDGQQAVTVSRLPDLKTQRGAILTLWELSTGSKIREIEENGEWSIIDVNLDVAVSIVQNDLEDIKVWELSAGRPYRSFQFFAARCLALSLDGKRLAASSNTWSSHVEMWDVISGREIGMAKEFAGVIENLVISTNGNRIYTQVKGEIKEWDLAASRDSHEKYFIPCDTVAASTDGRVAIAMTDKVQLLNPIDGREIRVLLKERTSRIHQPSENIAAISAHSKIAITHGDDDDRWDVWDLENKTELPFIAKSGVKSVALSDEAQMAVTASKDHLLVLWDVKSGNQVHSISWKGYSSPHLRFNHEGTEIIIANDSISIWNVKSDEELSPNQWPDDLECICLSPGGELAILTPRFRFEHLEDSAEDAKTCVWQVRDGRVVCQLEDFQPWWGAEKTCIGISSNGRFVATCSGGHIRIWSLTTGACQARFTSDAHILCCAFCGDTRIIAGDSQGNVHFLQFASFGVGGENSRQR